MLLKSVFLAALSFVGGSSAASAVHDLTPKTFDSVVLSGTPGLVEFFAPWCGHCKNLAPVYEELGAAFAHAKDKVHISRVDADAERSLGNRFGIQGFPTLKWFDGKSEKPVEEYNGGRDLESLSAFITERTGVKAKGIKKPAAEKSEVVMLNDKTFKETIGKDKDVLVAFTAPWCGHCKRLVPTYEALAETFVREPSVIIAKIDCEHEASKQIAIEQGIQGFPTIKFFPRGSTEPLDYASGRDELSFVQFINEHAGTDRTVGGGLGSKGGLIEALDVVVKKWNGKNLDKVTTQLKQKAEELKDNKYAAYYVRVAEKLKANEGYVDKETARLEKVIAKGGVSGEKMDDLVVRKNILGKFVPSDVENETDEDAKKGAETEAAKADADGEAEHVKDEL